MKYSFRTSTGEILTPDDPRLIDACEKVATQIEQSAVKVREENAFAFHVTQAEKDDYINRFYIDWAAKIRKRENLNDFSVWQRINTELTEECVAFLPK